MRLEIWVIYELVLEMKVKPCIDPQKRRGQGLILISLGFMSGIVMI